MNTRRCGICGEIVDGGVTGVREHLTAAHDHAEVALALSERILACPECGSERVEAGDRKRQCWKCGHVWRTEPPEEQPRIEEFAGD